MLFGFLWSVCAIGLIAYALSIRMALRSNAWGIVTYYTLAYGTLLAETPPGAPPEGSISFPALETRLIALADEAMYRAKRSGGNRAEKAGDLAWSLPEKEPVSASSPDSTSTT